MNYQHRSFTFKRLKSRNIASKVYASVLVASCLVTSLATESSSAINIENAEEENVTSDSEIVNQEIGISFNIPNFIPDDEDIVYEVESNKVNDDNTDKEDAIIYEETEDEDPLSFDKFYDEYVNPFDIQSPNYDELIAKYAKHFDHPGTPFYIREKRDISYEDYAIIENVVLGEVSFCSFEQMCAEASLCLNLSEQEKKDMYTLVMTPGVFSERYAVKTQETTEEVRLAIEAAMMGFDFSCGATAACTYEWMDKCYQDWFDTLKLTVKIEDSSFYCNPDDVFEFDEYDYSDELQKMVKLN